jgi:hypothetical protein
MHLSPAAIESAIRLLDVATSVTTPGVPLEDVNI